MEFHRLLWCPYLPIKKSNVMFLCTPWRHAGGVHLELCYFNLVIKRMWVVSLSPQPLEPQEESPLPQWIGSCVLGLAPELVCMFCIKTFFTPFGNRTPDRPAFVLVTVLITLFHFPVWKVNNALLYCLSKRYWNQTWVDSSNVNVQSPTLCHRLW